MLGWTAQYDAARWGVIRPLIPEKLDHEGSAEADFIMLQCRRDDLFQRLWQPLKMEAPEYGLGSAEPVKALIWRWRPQAKQAD